MNDVVVKSENAMANIEAELAKKAEAMKENITFSGNTITLTQTGKLKLPSGDEFDELDLVVVDYRYRNQFFPKPYKRGEFQPATCFAVGIQNNDNLIPSDDAPEKQAESCAACPKNVFGSHPNGSGKACQNQFIMAVMMADLGESEEMFMLKASPTAVKQIGGHILKMVDSYGHPIKTITRISVEEKGGYPKIKAAFAGPNGDYVAHAEHLQEAKRLLEASPVPAQTGVTAPEDTSNKRGSRAKD